jgi:hypothetical protein
MSAQQSRKERLFVVSAARLDSEKIAFYLLSVKLRTALSFRQKIKFCPTFEYEGRWCPPFTSKCGDTRRRQRSTVSRRYRDSTLAPAYGSRPIGNAAKGEFCTSGARKALRDHWVAATRQVIDRRRDDLDFRGPWHARIRLLSRCSILHLSIIDKMDERLIT